MRITKVYTRTGDAGQTRLAGGQQVWKATVRAEAYGTVDELNAALGFVQAMNEEALPGRLRRSNSKKTFGACRTSSLMSAVFSPPPQGRPNMPTLKEQNVVELEWTIDRRQQDLAPLQDFILPGGGRVSIGRGRSAV